MSHDLHKCMWKTFEEKCCSVFVFIFFLVGAAEKKKGAKVRLNCIKMRIKLLEFLLLKT